MVVDDGQYLGWCLGGCDYENGCLVGQSRRFFLWRRKFLAVSHLFEDCSAAILDVYIPEDSGDLVGYALDLQSQPTYIPSSGISMDKYRSSS